MIKQLCPICLLPLLLVVPAWADFIAVGFNGGRVASINELTGAVQLSVLRLPTPAWSPL